MVKINCARISTKSIPELRQEVEKMRRDLINIRIKTHGKQAQKTLEIRHQRRNIARFLTLANQKAKSKLRSENAGKKYKPLDLRSKKTRAMRRALTPSEKGSMTVRQVKRSQNFPMRKYAVRE